MGFPYTRELVREFIMYAPWRLHPRIPHHILSRMYTCERLGENATEFRYATIDGGHLGSGSGGAWVRAAVAVAGVSLFAQSLASKGSGCLGFVGLALVLSCLAWSLGCRSRVREESLLVVRELGVQVTTKYVDGREKSTFLDKAKIKAILINEGITMHRVVFYLAFVVDGRDKMVVAFENLKPRLHILVKIYRGTRAAILGEAGDEQLQDDEGGFNTSSVASATPGIGSGHGGRGDGETRRVLSTGRTDRIARRQARNEASASGKGWPPPQMPNF